MRDRNRNIARLLCGAAVGALSLWAGLAQAAETPRAFSIEPQPLSTALMAFGAQSGHAVMAPTELMAERMSRGVVQSAEPEAALTQLLEGTGLTFRRTGETFAIVQAGEGGSGPQGASAGDVDALIVTAQKREENIQDVPIAISAFSQEDLTTRQVAGGPDLITQIPNFSFTKTNFSGYSIQIRGIGTQAVSATTDPAVAVAFNNTPFVRNRFFEQEFYDLERVEVLRGPQGTLYGRNATAGVVNIISAKPKFSYEAKVSADVGNYSSRRLEAMANFPLVEDVVALRLAGAWTQRSGYATNQTTGAQIDGRDLWSTRVSLRFEPNDWISANFLWEHFQEDDDRLRSGKQLCKRHVVTEVGGLTVTNSTAFSGQAKLSQGCTAVSLYSSEAFQTPNGYALPYYGPLGSLGLPVFETMDPYRSSIQSRDLRVIESSVEPDYRANTDIAELQISVDLSDSLTLSSETAYGADSLFSLQDYNRFTTANGAFKYYDDLGTTPNGVVKIDGSYCDPQLGCSDRLLLVDLSTSESTQFSQEFRLGSDFDGPLNFSLGANYLRHDAEDKYYVFINSLSLWAEWRTMSSSASLGRSCRGRPGLDGETGPLADPTLVYGLNCPYMDPNPIGALDDMGRNYFLSKNPYKLISYAAFGEIYYNITPDLKLTGGLRFTVDRKTAPQIPSWLLAGEISGPYPTLRTVVQEWKEPTGRLALDWKPVLPFTDETLVYASYAHGYKAGGANPPPPVFATWVNGGAPELLPDVFDPEFVDAYEVGTKNTLFGGALTLNLTGFYYDYKGYQVSEIRNRSAVNSNYDTEVRGAELEADWRATEALRLGFKAGWQEARIADGEKAIDLMDRTAGEDGWVVLKPFPSVPSNCIMPVEVITAGGRLNTGGQQDGPCIDAYYNGLDPITMLPFDPSITNYANAPKAGGGVLGAAYANYHGFDPSTAPNGGRGFDKQLGGNELPNAPNYTATVTADYTMPLRGDWMVNFHGDYHYQSESWARVFNSDPYDRIEGFSTVNLSAIFTNEEAGWKVMTYIKNVFDETAITGAFLNSDDSGLTTNVFLTEPRLYGVRVTKDFNGSVFGWSSDGERRDPGEPYPFRVEIGGGVGRFDSGAETYYPDWMTPALSGALSPQGDDPDWGDTRNVKLTYAPANDWHVSTAYLYGKTNGQGRGDAHQDVPGGVGYGNPVENDNYAVGAFHAAEEYAIAEFSVGKEIGLGAIGEDGKSAVSAGLRFANFKSSSRMALDGVSESYVAPEIFFKYPSGAPRSHFETHTTTLSSVREFEGVGPSLGWDASIRLLGGAESGSVDLEWSVGGGVLFGKQTADSSEDRVAIYYLGVNDSAPRTPLYDDVVPRRRSENVTVPNLSLSLGLSYSIDRVKVSTGYAYDRYFDAIDGGVDTAKQYDRTIHGPFVKLSIGFGG